MEPRCLFVLLLVGSVSAYDWTLYDSHAVYKAVPSNSRQAGSIQTLAVTKQIDLSLDTVLVDTPVYIRVSAEARDALLSLLHDQNIDHEIHIADLGEHMKTSWERLQGKAAFDYADYNTFTDILNELDALAADCPTGFTCTLQDVGTTLEGRPLRQLTIQTGSGRDRPFIWLDSMVHAREWLAGATLMPITQRLIREYGTNVDATRLMDTFNWYILPAMNPDGYVYTWEVDRFWRKNRNPDPESTCYGVDLNRNYDFNWGQSGSSPDPCSNTYHGVAPASEPETQAIQARATEVGAGVVGWLSLHCKGQYVLLPYSNGSRPVDNDDLTRNVDVMCAAIMDTYNTTWDCGNAMDVLYEMSGDTIDWAKGVLGIKYPYIPELRGETFDPPPAQIPPSFNEVWNGVVAYADDIFDNLAP